MNIKTISNKIKDGGAIIDLDNSKDILKIQNDTIIKIFENHGIILFKNFDLDPKKLTLFTDKFTSRYSSDALRRDIRFENKNIRNVDGGNIKVDLHSESSFNPAWPEIIWFYCNHNDVEGGETILCDGLILWENLSLDAKNFFQQNSILYELKIPIEKKSKLKGRKQWPMNSLGVIDSFIDWDEGALYLKQIRSGVVESRKDNSLCFSNHLFIDLSSEPQILSRKTNSDNEIPENILAEIHRCAQEITLNLRLEKKDLVMLDNKRFMHGRNAFGNSGKRDIVNIQTFKANFAYGSSFRK